MSTATEAVTFSNIAANTARFALRGGKYAASVVAAFGGGSVKLQALLPDGVNFVSVSSGTDFTAAGYGLVDLPAGQYRFTIATATAVFCNVCEIPS